VAVTFDEFKHPTSSSDAKNPSSLFIPHKSNRPETRFSFGVDQSGAAIMNIPGTQVPAQVIQQAQQDMSNQAHQIAPAGAVPPAVEPKGGSPAGVPANNNGTPAGSGISGAAPAAATQPGVIANNDTTAVVPPTARTMPAQPAANRLTSK
jgi:hypothetical protein